MTLKELSQLFWLKKEIALHQQRLAEIRAAMQSPKAQNLSGMPKGGGRNLIEVQTEEILRLEGMIDKLEQRCREERVKLESYIETIEDSHTRQIFLYRFEYGLTWVQIALKVGGGNTDDSVKKTCYRYLRKK